jgi:hypothetical protein
VGRGGTWKIMFIESMTSDHQLKASRVLEMKELRDPKDLTIHDA